MISAEATAVSGQIVCGVGTDQLSEFGTAKLDQVVAAYLGQIEFVERVGKQASSIAVS